MTENRNETRGMFARTLRLLRPLKIHPGILPATDLNNVAGEGGEAPPTLSFRIHTRREESHGNPKLGENRFLIVLPSLLSPRPH